jgi:hypothetical protein
MKGGASLLTNLQLGAGNKVLLGKKGQITRIIPAAPVRTIARPRAPIMASTLASKANKPPVEVIVYPRSKVISTGRACKVLDRPGAQSLVTPGVAAAGTMMVVRPQKEGAATTSTPTAYIVGPGGKILSTSKLAPSNTTLTAFSSSSSSSSSSLKPIKLKESQVMKLLASDNEDEEEEEKDKVAKGQEKMDTEKQPADEDKDKTELKGPTDKPIDSKNTKATTKTEPTEKKEAGTKQNDSGGDEQKRAEPMDTTPASDNIVRKPTDGIVPKANSSAASPAQPVAAAASAMDTGEGGFTIPPAPTAVASLPSLPQKAAPSAQSLAQKVKSKDISSQGGNSPKPSTNLSPLPKNTASSPASTSVSSPSSQVTQPAKPSTQTGGASKPASQPPKEQPSSGPQNGPSSFQRAAKSFQAQFEQFSNQMQQQASFTPPSFSRGSQLPPTQSQPGFGHPASSGQPSFSGQPTYGSQGPTQPQACGAQQSQNFSVQQSQASAMPPSQDGPMSSPSQPGSMGTSQHLPPSQPQSQPAYPPRGDMMGQHLPPTPQFHQPWGLPSSSSSSSSYMSQPGFPHYPHYSHHPQPPPSSSGYPPFSQANPFGFGASQGQGQNQSLGEPGQPSAFRPPSGKCLDIVLVLRIFCNKCIVQFSCSFYYCKHIVQCILQIV